jgi:hypothetical protein
VTKRERLALAAAIEAEGRRDVEWLAKVATDDLDRARTIGAEEAWRAAARLVREWDCYCGHHPHQPSRRPPTAVEGTEK